MPGDTLADGLRRAADGYGILWNGRASTDVDVHELLTRSAGIVLPRISAVPHICKHRRSRWRAHYTFAFLMHGDRLIHTHCIDTD